MKLFTLFFSLLVCCACYCQKTTIQLNFTVGQAYRLAQASQSQINQTINGEESTSGMTLSGTTKFTVRAAHDSVYEMDVIFERLAFKQTTPQGEKSFDSDNNSQDIVGTILHSVVNTSFELVMSKSGRIIKTNADTIFSVAIDQRKELNEEQRSLLKNQMKQSFGEKAFKGSFEMYSAIYPTTPVKTGDTWPVRTSLQSIVAADMNGIYTLKDATGSFYQIHGETKMNSIPTDKPAFVNGLPLTYNLSGNMITDLNIDSKTGWIQSAKISQDLKGIMKILDCQQVPGGMEVPMSATTTITLADN